MKKLNSITEKTNWAGINKSAQRGITLVSLVVTIIVIMILAGVTINFVIGENGIITKANMAKEEAKIGEITEKLEMIKPLIYIDNLKSDIGIDDYLNYLQKEQEEGNLGFEISDIDRVDENNVNIIVDDKYVFSLECEDDGDIKASSEGKVGELKPRIVNVMLSNTTNSIKATVEAKRAEEYNFYIKDSADGEYKLKEEGNKDGEYTYTGLTQNLTYYIKIEAINENGKVETEMTRITGTMVQITEAELETSMTPSTWTNKNVTTKVTINTSKNVSGYYLQYVQATGSLGTEQLKNANWNNYTTSGIISEQNETIYFRLYDGTNSTSYMSRKVEIIDKTVPTVSSVSVSTNSAEVTATDTGGAGIKEYAVTTSTTAPTTGYQTSKTFSGLTQNKTYYAWAKDNAGNVSVSKSFKTGTVTTGTGNITFTLSPSTWTNGSVTATASTNVTGLTLQTSTDGSTWKAQASQTFSANGTIYARLVDSTNQYNGTASTSITIIDKTAPTVSSVSTTTNSATITASDTGGSGVSTYAVTTSNTKPTSGFKTSKTFSSLTQNKTYYAWTKDAAGNVSASKSFTTGQVTTGTGNITFTLSPSTWTNGSVTATASTNVTGLTLQTSTDGSTWKTQASQTFSANGTIYARLIDSTNQYNGTASTSITRIDKTVPTISTALSAHQNASATAMTLNVGVTDANSGLGKIIWYYKLSNASSYTSVEQGYTTLNGTTAGTTTAVSKSKQITGLTASTTYNAYAKVYDVAGNSKDTAVITFTTPKAVASVGTTKYISATKAIEAISSSGTVTMLSNSTESLTIPSGKTINLDTAGYTITGNVTNNGTLNISGRGKLTSTGCTITNAGTLTSTDATIDSTSTDQILINNTGNITINSGTITTTFYAMSNNGMATLKGGTWNSVVINESQGKMIISGGNYTTGISHSLMNHGEVTINGSAVLESTSYTTVYSYGTLYLEGGTIKSSVSNVISNRSGATLIMSGGNVIGTSSKYPAIYNYGTFRATGGSVSGAGYAIYNNGGTASVAREVTITGSTYGY